MHKKESRRSFGSSRFKLEVLMAYRMLMLRMKETKLMCMHKNQGILAFSRASRIVMCLEALDRRWSTIRQVQSRCCWTSKRSSSNKIVMLSIVPLIRSINLRPTNQTLKDQLKAVKFNYLSQTREESISWDLVQAWGTSHRIRTLPLEPVARALSSHQEVVWSKIKVMHSTQASLSHLPQLKVRQE
jgi:hypothetical protein